MNGLGVWASLVLDAQVARANERASRAPVVAAPPPPSAPGTVELPSTRRGEDAQLEALRAEQPDAPRPKSAPIIEVGVSSVLATGVGIASAPAYVGAGAFTFVETGRGVFLRPSLSYARSVEQAGDVWGTRFDVCARAPGNYIDRKGLQFNACLGPEGGLVGLPSGRPQRVVLGLGPSISLRGDLGNVLAVEVRATSSYNVIRGLDGDPIAPLSIAAELGLSWAVR